MPNTFPFYDAEPYWPASGYGNGGGGGSSTASLTDFWLWNNATGHLTEIPSSVSYVSDIDRETVLTDLRFDAVTMVNNGVTMYGVHVYDCPVGAILKLECNNISDCTCALCYLPSADLDPVDQGIELGSSNICLMPIDGYIISGIYYSAVA